MKKGARRSERLKGKSNAKSSRTRKDPNVKTPKETTGKRENYINWKEYFMAMALVSAQRSKDPKTQVGACIVNNKKRIVGLGYNGFPDRCSDDIFSWKKLEEKDEEGKVKNKHLYVCHAEMNAIMNKMAVDIQGCTMYTTLYPCNECTKLIIQSGIDEVIYYTDKEDAASEAMLDAAGIHIKKYKPNRQTPLKIGKGVEEFLL